MSVTSKQGVVLYSKSEIEQIKIASKIAASTLKYIEPYVKPGISTLELNDLCHEYILAQGANPSPLNYRGFPKSVCTSVNHVVCHGIPSENKVLKEGDIINIDVTVDKNGFYGDTSFTFMVGKVSIKAKLLVEVTQQCLMAAIDVVKPNAKLGDIGAAIESIAKRHRFGIVQDFCGHGIGNQFHQPPNILHYGKAGTGLTIEEGMVFTIEPMINTGSHEVKILSDGWTAVTRDHSLSAQFEHTIAVTSDGCLILTLVE